MVQRRSHAESAAAREVFVPVDAAVEVTLFHDLFCAWSYIADQRLQTLRDEYGSEVRWTWRPFPLRPEAIALDKKQRGMFARSLKKAAREAEGDGMVADLWTGNDPPSSSLPPLLALEAARHQGLEKQRELLSVMRRAVFLRGLNVARVDVQLELAESAGLDLSDFLSRLELPETEEAVAQSVHDAETMGIRGVPALVIGDEWLMQGCREIGEYRQVIEKYLHERSRTAELRVVH